MKGVIRDYEKSTNIRSTYSALPFQGVWDLVDRERNSRKKNALALKLDRNDLLGTELGVWRLNNDDAVIIKFIQ